MSDDTPDAIIASLKPMFDKADAERLLFYGNYHEIWFTPDDLRAHHRQGKFIWGPVNWTLRTREDYLAGKRRVLLNAQSELAAAEQKLRDGSLYPARPLSGMSP